MLFWHFWSWFSSPKPPTVDFQKMPHYLLLPSITFRYHSNRVHFPGRSPLIPWLNVSPNSCKMICSLRMWLKIILLIIKTRGGDAGWSKECLRRGKTKKTQKSWKTLKNDEFGGFWWYFMDLEGFQVISWDFGDISKVFEGISLRKLASGPEIDRKSCVASLRTRGGARGEPQGIPKHDFQLQNTSIQHFPGVGRPTIPINSGYYCSTPHEMAK